MKRKLMIQSMSLLALLTFIRNCSVNTVDSTGIKLSWDQFLVENVLILFVLGACVLWVLLAAAYENHGFTHCIVPPVMRLPDGGWWWLWCIG